MGERTGYRIPAQGSPMNVTQPEALFPLIQERLDGSLSVSSASETEPTSSTGGIRKRDRSRSLDADSVEKETIVRSTGLSDTISGTIEHEETVDTFEDHLSQAGFDGGETDNSDLIMHSDDHVIPGEAKFIHSDNGRSQIRHGLGQLLEYRHIDIDHSDQLADLELTACLILSQEPSTYYREVLQSLEDNGIYTYWIDGGSVQGLADSMARLDFVTR